MPLGRFAVYFCSLVALCLIAFPQTVPTPAPEPLLASGCVDGPDGSVTCPQTPADLRLANRRVRLPRVHARRFPVLMAGGPTPAELTPLPASRTA